MEGEQRSRKLLTRGMFAIDKPPCMTSTKAVEKVKITILQGLKAKDRPHPLKVGHGGTLDFSATGILPIGVCSGCKMLTKMLHGKKVYSFTGILGVETETYDATGQVMNKIGYDHITREMFDEAVQTFIGKISQVPPKFSALKKSGKRLSDLVRAGVEVVVEPRTVECFSIKCIEFSPPVFKLEVECGGGFYIRSLAHDLGIKLGSCAHVKELRRVQHGMFTEVDALSMKDLTVEKILKAMEETLTKYSHVEGAERSSNS